jgi:hypothetical protein
MAAMGVSEPARAIPCTPTAAMARIRQATAGILES